jgi:polyhydroxybutyrate depolymerase
LVLLVVAALAGLAGCGRGQPVPTPIPTAGEPPRGSSAQVITVDGVERSFRLYVPAPLSLARPVPLVLMLHGGFGSAGHAEAAYGWNGAADRYGFVVAYPDGLGRAWSVGGGCCGRPGRTGTDDVAFITAVVAGLGDRLAVDRSRVFATGMSNGAMMAYRLACESTVFAAIAPVAGTLMGPCPQPRPLSLLHIHGLADASVPFDGSPGTGYEKIDGPDIPSTMDIWRVADDCEPPRVEPGDPVTRSTADCAAGRSVTLITIAGAGHQWPGAKDRTPAGALDATDVIWQFFAAHPRPPRG